MNKWEIVVGSISGVSSGSHLRKMISSLQQENHLQLNKNGELQEEVCVCVCVCEFGYAPPFFFSSLSSLFSSTSCFLCMCVCVLVFLSVRVWFVRMRAR
jgi:hypothetical protein